MHAVIIYFTVCLYTIKKYFSGTDSFACSFLVLIAKNGKKYFDIVYKCFDIVYKCKINGSKFLFL